MRSAIPFLVMILGACQTAPEPAVPDVRPSGQQNRTRPDTSFQSYAWSLAKNREQLAEQGLAAEHAAVRSYVDAFLPAGLNQWPGVGPSEAERRRVRVESVTNNLVNHGYRGIHFVDAAQAKRLVGAAAGIFGASGEGDLATFVPTVVIAELVRADDAADGSSALVYRVVEPIKNAPPKGATIRLTLRTATPPSPFPPPPQPGEGELRLPGRVALFLSPPRVIGELRGTGDAYARFTAPMRLEGEQLTPGYHSDVPEITLRRLRAVVREQVCATGFVAVGAAGTSLAC